MTTASAARPARTRDLAFIAMMAALTAICAWITVPFSIVPFTLQTFAVFLSLALLGGKRGTAAIALYLCLGLVGLPVFAGFRGGVGPLLGPTGGYLAGFLFTGLLYWAITAKLEESLPVKLVALILGLAVCYAFGTLWFLRVYTDPISVKATLMMCVIPYIPADAVKLALALAVSRRVGKAVRV